MSEIANEPVSTTMPVGSKSGREEDAVLPRFLSIDYGRILVDPGIPNPLESAWVFDPTRRRIVMWGGAGAYRDGISILTLDPPRRWTRLPLSSNEPPVAASAVRRAVDNTMIVFGGRDTNKTEGANSRVDVFTLDASPAYLGDYSPGPGPAARWGHCAVYDSTGDAMYVFGGQAPGNVKFNDVWKLSFSPFVTWTQLSPTGTAPSARVGASMVLDPSGHRLVIHGGSPGFNANGPTPPLLSDTWALALDPTPHWTQLTTGAPGPATCLAAADYDAVADRMLVFGGRTLSPPADSSTWELSLGLTPAWTNRTATVGLGPAPRCAGIGLVDPATQRFIVVGGAGESASFIAVTALDASSLALAPGSTWATWAIDHTRPASVALPTVLFDAVDSSFVVIGASQMSSATSNIFTISATKEVWKVKLTNNGSVWTALPPLPFGDGFAYGTTPAILDAPLRRVVAWLVYTPDDLNYQGQVWQLSLNGTPAWTQLSPLGAAPTPRAGSGVAFDAGRRSLMIFGGSDFSTNYSDAWRLELTNTTATWQLLAGSGTGPSSRYLPAAEYDPWDDRLLVFGGADSVYHNDLWSLPLGTQMWSQLSPTGSLPAPRAFARLVRDPLQRTMLLVSGFANSLGTRDDWVLTLGSSPAWSAFSNPSGTDNYASAFSGAVWDPVGRRVLTFGGERRFGTVITDPSAIWALVSPPCSTPGYACVDPALRAVFFGGSATISFCSAAPPADSVRWYYEDVPLHDGAHYSGTTGMALTIIDAQAGQNGAYTLHLVNECGTTVTTVVGVSVLDPFDFSSPQAAAAGGEPLQTGAADVTGDGAGDAVVATAQNQILVHAGAGDGSLGGGILAATVASPSGMIVGPFDTDAIGDILVASTSGNTLRSLHGLGGGSFSSTAVATIGSPGALGFGRSSFAAALAAQSPAVRSAVAASESGAAPEDAPLSTPTHLIAVASAGSGIALHPVSPGPGGLTISPVATVLEPTHYFQDVVMADVSQDGYADIIGCGDDQMMVWIDDGSGVIPAPNVFEAPPGTGRIQVADFHQDNSPDIVVLEEGNGNVYEFEGIGFGEFLPFMQLSLDTFEGYAWRFTSGDYDGDGAPDLLITTPAKGQVGLLRGSPTGWFPMRPISAMFGIQDVATGAFNTDGRPDLLVSTGAGGTIAVMLNRPPHTTASVPDRPPRGASNPLGVMAAPNPFLVSTSLRFELARASEVTIRILDVSGRRLREIELGHRPAGLFSVDWDGRDESGAAMSAGLYFAQIVAGGERGACRLVRVR